MHHSGYSWPANGACAATIRHLFPCAGPLLAVLASPMSHTLVSSLVLACAVWALAAGPVQAQTAAASAQAHAMTAVRLQPDERIVLDGTLSHPAWQRAPEHGHFVEKMPNTGGVPAHATRVQVLFDEQALYVGVRALDAEPERIRAPLVRHDNVNRTQDFVVVYLDAIGQRQSAQFFRVNAAGGKADGMYTAADDSEDFSPDFDFDAVSARDAQGWTAVFRIPFASLRFASEGPPAWRIMVGRRVPREQFYLHTSVLIPRDAANFIATMQPLLGVQLPERAQFLTVRPSVTLRQSKEQPAGAAATRRSETSASLDLKWRPRAEWVIDATLNPDFSQVALDVPQLAGNTRFALFFPEKRPFFFESSDLLRSPTEAMYTRSFTEPRWGLRSTWRGNHLAGTAFAIDDRGGGLVLLPSAWGSGAAEQPASRALAARFNHDSGGLQWGGLAVARHYADGRGSNQVLGPDLAWQLNDAWRARAQWLQSDTTAQADAAGQLRSGPAQRGQRTLLRLNWQGDSADANVMLDDIGSGFRHDTGFVNQSGVRRIESAAAKGWQKVGPLNEFWFNVHADETRAKGGGGLVSRDVYGGIWMTGAHNLETSLTWHGDAQLRTAPDAALLHQAYWRADLTVTPAQWIPFLRSNLRWGRIADVQANAVRRGGDMTITLTTRPLARLEFEPSVSMARIERDGRLAYREVAAQVLGVWHFNAQQTLRAIVQRTSLQREAEPGVAAARDAGTVGSLTWAWRRSVGSVLYLGASRSKQGLGLASRSNELFIKLQADWDDLRQAF